jgi:hypothetical protein
MYGVNLAMLDDLGGTPGLTPAESFEQFAYALVRELGVRRWSIASHAAFDDPVDVADLLDSLRAAGAEQQAAILADRAAADASLDDVEVVDELLGALRRAGAEQQAGRLVDRLPAEGRFDLFHEQPGHEMRYRFGYEPDRSPAPSWGWHDLD